MVLKVKEKNIYYRRDYQFYLNSTDANIEVNVKNNQNHKSDFSVSIDDKTFVNCYHNMLHNKYFKGFGKSITSTALLDKNHNLIGSIVLKTSSNKGLKYYYKEIKYKSDNYYAYEIGLGSEGYYTFLYKNNDVVGAISKDNIVHLNQDTYSLYSIEDNEVKTILIILMLRWDAQIAEGAADSVHNGEITGKRIECFVSPQKELKDKYDPEFIPRIKAQEGIMD